MPREGVPYPSREICSLKCQIDALQRQINELMKSINGVEGDGQGNVSLISGDPAIVINNDAVQNQIEIALDNSQLPAAVVSSVNGQTGAVDLDGADIPLNPGQSTPTVQNAVAANAGNISQLQADLNQEILDRGNADSALQSNINAVSAGLPAATAAAVAADPTVAQLAVDVPNKLDKITSGSALKAYTHTGATQGEKSIVDGTTADSIAIRDANGRLTAADPSNGATNNTLVTANWVSQSGNSSPNNIMHKNGSENFSGIKKATGAGFIRKVSSALNLSTPSASGTITDENYVMEDINGNTAVQMFNSYSAGAQTIFQIATKYPFTENGQVKVTNGILWLTTYADHVSLYLRFVDKNGTSHMSEIARVTQ